MNDKPTETYVTFKWMLVQTLALVMTVIGTVVTIAFLIVSSINSRIDMGLNSKVSIIQFDERTKSLTQTDNELCDLIKEYKEDKKVTNDRLGLIEQHLAILVGKPITKSKKEIP